MLDKTVKFYDIIMKRPGGPSLPGFELPEGFRFVMYAPGDEESWARITQSVGDFPNMRKALKYFRGEFCSPKELGRRCVFVEDAGGKKVATFTAWWDYIGKKRVPLLHWLAVCPEYQGLGLAKALVSKILEIFDETEGVADIYLHTQTWSYKAVNIYSKFGFCITDEKGLGGCENNDWQKASQTIKPYLK
jgi:GNAT superfamily N-acetyltransferase